MMKRLLAVILALMLILSCVAFADEEIKKITFSQKSVSLPVDMTVNLKELLEPEDAQSLELIWKSGKESVASVDENGMVTGIGKGQAAVTVQSGKLKAKITVNVDEYDIIFTEYAEQNATYYYIRGKFNIKASVKNGCVSIQNINGSAYVMSTSNSLMSDTFWVKPLKEGADVITVSAGKTKTTIKVYVTPEAVSELKKEQEAKLKEYEANKESGANNCYLQIKGLLTSKNKDYGLGKGKTQLSDSSATDITIFYFSDMLIFSITGPNEDGVNETIVWDSIKPKKAFAVVNKICQDWDSITGGLLNGQKFKITYENGNTRWDISNAETAAKFVEQKGKK